MWPRRAYAWLSPRRNRRRRRLTAGPDGVDEEEYRAFTTTLLKILRNVGKLPESERERRSISSTAL